MSVKEGNLFEGNFFENNKVMLVHYMDEHPDFRAKITSTEQNLSYDMASLIATAIEEELFETAKAIFEEVFEKIKDDHIKVHFLTKGLIHQCKCPDKIDALEFFENEMLPIVETCKGRAVEEYLDEWHLEIENWKIDNDEGYKQAVKELVPPVGIVPSKGHFCEMPESVYQTKYGEKLYIYCGVSFSNGYDIYSYRTNDSTINVGDTVIVPVRNKDKTEIGTVKFVGLYDSSKASYPPEKTKYIMEVIERVTDNEADYNKFAVGEISISECVGKNIIITAKDGQKYCGIAYDYTLDISSISVGDFKLYEDEIASIEMLKAEPKLKFLPEDIFFIIKNIPNPEKSAILSAETYSEVLEIFSYWLDSIYDLPEYDEVDCYSLEKEFEKSYRSISGYEEHKKEPDTLQIFLGKAVELTDIDGDVFTGYVKTFEYVNDSGYGEECISLFDILENKLFEFKESKIASIEIVGIGENEYE